MSTVSNKSPQSLQNDPSKNVQNQVVTETNSKPPIKRSNTTLFLVLVLLLFSLALNLILGYIAIKYADDKSLDSAESQRNVMQELADNIKKPDEIAFDDIKDIDTLELLELYPEIKWEEASSSADLDIMDKILIDGMLTKVEGNYRFYQDTYDKEEIDKLIANFESYYKVLEVKGWEDVSGIKLGDTRYSPMSASGVDGDVWGYIAKKDNNIRAINLGYHIGYFVDEVDYANGVYNRECPCVLLLEVFESEIFSIDSLAPNEQ